MSTPSSVTKAGIDVVAEVLKELSKGGEIKPDKAKEAIQKYNEKMESLAFYKQEIDKKTDTRNEISKKARREMEELTEENNNLKKKIEELEQRLSAVIGQKITAGNPDIADLSDQHRPTNLAEKFKLLYDDEWTNAYEEIDTVCKQNSIKKEEKIIKVLVDITKEVDHVCEMVCNQQLDSLMAIVKDDLTNPKLHKGKYVYSVEKSVMDSSQENKLMKMLKDMRKEFAELSITPVYKIFYDYKLKQILKDLKMKTAPKMDEFVRKLIHIIWMMKAQNPPMFLCWPEVDKQFNKDRFTFYTKSGDVIAFVVWPSVLLHKDGPQMSKGIVQGK